ncbi:MAG: MarR family transcriptional regulator [Ignavibacteriae bacterium]|nr:MarR family transcriptional regulator [Ignavibacteriota bacterium]MCB9206041.1 MarR family transcriptional regulator [Ignavibacteriales bacterium]MCB9209316.1 MarR family transcriptional regulator [Ignavibacteriales bacterium]MCB9257960.1 MarR family transcriptional regulator [Ignavibacteriales bacterium]
MAKQKKEEQVLDLYNLVAKAHDKLKKVHAKHLGTEKLTTPQFGVLDVLMRKGSIPLKKISDELMVTGANITCVMDNLEKEDLVRRVHSKSDRRVINAELTPKGKQKLDKIYPEHVRGLNEFSKKISDAEMKQLATLLEKLSA